MHKTPLVGKTDAPQAEWLDAQFSGAKGYLPEDGLHNKNVLLQETHKSQDWRTPHRHERNVLVISPGIATDRRPMKFQLQFPIKFNP